MPPALCSTNGRYQRSDKRRFKYDVRNSERAQCQMRLSITYREPDKQNSPSHAKAKAKRLHLVSNFLVQLASFLEKTRRSNISSGRITSVPKKYVSRLIGHPKSLFLTPSTTKLEMYKLERKGHTRRHSGIAAPRLVQTSCWLATAR